MIRDREYSKIYLKGILVKFYIGGYPIINELDVWYKILKKKVSWSNEA